MLSYLVFTPFHLFINSLIISFQGNRLNMFWARCHKEIVGTTMVAAFSLIREQALQGAVEMHRVLAFIDDRGYTAFA